jgi:hypothetical protein
MKTFKDIESKLETVKIKPLSAEEKIVLWSNIEKGMIEPQKSPFFQKIVSPFASFHFQKSLAFSLITAVIFGTSGVAFAYADSAKPGDVLFPLSVVKEKIIISLTPTKNQNEVRLKYAEKRIEQGNEFLATINAKVVTSTTTRDLADEIATGTMPIVYSKHQKATTSPAIVSDAVSRLSATIAYLQGVKADLVQNGNTSAAQTIQNAIDKILEQITVAANQNTIVIAKIKEHKNQFNVVVSTKNASTTMTTNIAINTKKDTQKVTITEKENKSIENNRNKKEGDDDKETDNDKKDKDSRKNGNNNEDKDENENDKNNEDDGREDENNNGFLEWLHLEKKTDVCHKEKTINVASSAINAHLKHGDKLGTCKEIPSVPATDTIAPVVSNVSSSVTATSAKVVWDTNENTTAVFWYGTTTAFELSVSLANLATHQETNLSPLLSDVTYLFAIVAKDAAGNTGTSTTGAFKTSALSDTTAPIISDIVVTHASEIATISWKTNESATGKIYYGTATPIVLATAPDTKQDGAYSLNHSFNLTGLATSTTYYFVLEGKDATGNIGTSTEQHFETGA